MFTFLNHVDFQPTSVIVPFYFAKVFLVYNSGLTSGKDDCKILFLPNMSIKHINEAETLVSIWYNHMWIQNWFHF